MSGQYEIVREKGDWFTSYVGPWSIQETITTYTDFKEALELVWEWGLNTREEPRKHNKIGIYDHEEDHLYNQDWCLGIEKFWEQLK